jgi:electron transport complex protein RnfE
MTARDALWTANPATVRLLGLCPMLAVSTSAAAAFALGLATLITMAIVGAMVALLRTVIAPAARIPAFMLIIAAPVCAADLLFAAYLPDLSARLGIFVPLIITNCAVLARVELFASKSLPLAAARDGALAGFGLLIAITILGAVREFIGGGTMLANLNLLSGGDQNIAPLFAAGGGLPFALLPAGGFILFGFLIAAQSAYTERSKNLRSHELTMR